MRKLLFFVLSLTLVLSGCSSSLDAQSGAQIAISKDETPIENVKSTDEITLAMRTTSTLNPLLNADESVDSILRILFRPLVDIDETGKTVASIAESWYYSNDGTVLNVKLKEGLKWHDGNEITADDIVYSVNVLKNAPDNVVYKKCVEKITSCVKVGTYTLEVHFTGAFSGNIYSLTFLPISSKISQDNELQPVGNGYYRFESFTPAKELVLKATENSFGATPSISTVTVKMTTDRDTDLYSYSRRITDCVNAEEVDMGKYDLDSNSKKYSYVSNYYDFIGFNFNNAILSDKNIRKAVAYAVPKDDIIEGIYLSNAVPAVTPVSPSSYLYDSTIKDYEYSLETAKKHLDSVGYTAVNESGIRYKTNEEGTQNLSFRLLVNSENDERCQAAQKIRDELRAIGIEIKIEEVPYDQYKTKLESGDFDIFMGGWEISPDSYPGFMFSSAQIGGTNYISYSSEKMDNLLSAAYNAVSTATIQEAYSALEKEIAEELPYISLVYRKSALFVDERTSGEIKAYNYDCYKTIGNWHIE